MADCTEAKGIVSHYIGVADTAFLGFGSRDEAAADSKSGAESFGYTRLDDLLLLHGNFGYCIIYCCCNDGCMISSGRIGAEIDSTAGIARLVTEMA